MNQLLNDYKVYETPKAKFVSDRPESIREKVLAWAFDDASDAAEVIANLERLDCAACYSPAPIYFADMAHEIGQHWPEIDDALDDYQESTGEAWTPKPTQNFLTYLWFAYEWTAQQQADAIRDVLNLEG